MGAKIMDNAVYKILLIEHEFAIRYLIQNQLKSEGHEVLIAKDAISGMVMARSEKPDLIALNLHIPDFDGFLLFKEMKEDVAIASIPVVFMADQADQNDKFVAFDLGAADFIVKPFLADEFLARITAVLRKNIPEKKKQPTPNARVLTLFSPKGGVGTTTLSIQLAKAIAIQYERETALLDLDLPLGGVAQKLNLYTKDNIIDFLGHKNGKIDKDVISRYMQKQHTNLLVLPAPGVLFASTENPDATQLIYLFDYFTQQKTTVIVDVGSHLNALSLAALRRSDAIFAITSGKQVANQLINLFFDEANRLRLDKNRIFPVVNELYGRSDNDNHELARLPIARIPASGDMSTKRLWLQNPGIKKMVSFAC